METTKIQLLIDNLLSKDEQEVLILEIKNDPVKKAELALMLKIRELGRKKKVDLLKTAVQGTAAAISLSQIRSAAFNTKFAFEVDPLPISEETITDFLSDNDDD